MKLPLDKHQQDIVLAFFVGLLVAACLIWLATSVDVSSTCTGC